MSQVRLKDIAEELGVTLTTVQRAIYNKPDISEKTKKAVMELVGKYNYIPNKIARSLSLKKNIKIGAIVRGEPNFFWDVVSKGIEDAGEEIKEFGAKIILHRIENYRDAADIIELIDKIMEDGVDAIAIVPTEDDILRSKISELSEKGVKVATVNDDIEPSSRIFYVGPQLEKSGRVVADLMGMFLRNSEEVIVLNADLNSLVLSKRLKGFTELINEQYEKIHIRNFYYKWKLGYDIIYDSIKDILNNTSFDGLYCVDGYVLPMVGKILSEKSGGRQPLVIGHEISAEVAGYIENYIIRATVSQDPYSQGYNVIKYLFDYLLMGQKPEFDRMYTRLDIIMKENLEKNNNIISKHF